MYKILGSSSRLVEFYSVNDLDCQSILNNVEIRIDTLRSHLEQIIGPRHRGTEKSGKHLKSVINYITDNLNEFGYEVETQEIIIDNMKTAWGRSVSGYQGTNIIAELEGETDKILIIATHHDSVPRSPGADDNATGIAALLEIARYLADYSGRYKIRLISFDLEESGFLGSEWYVQHLTDKEKEKIKGMVMLEMLGYFTQQEQKLPTGFGLLYRKEIKRLKKNKEDLLGDFLTCVYRKDAKFIAEAFENTRDRSNMKVALIRDIVDLPVIGPIMGILIPSLNNLLRSDHTPFWYRNIPAVMITDTANFRNPNYHKPSDKIDTINFKGFTRATQRVLLAIKHILENQ